MGISREAYQGRHIKGTSRAHQSTSRAFQGHIKGISRAYQGHIRAHQGHFKGISRAYQGHIKGTSGHIKGISKAYPGHLKGTSGAFQKHIKGISREAYQGLAKGQAKRQARGRWPGGRPGSRPAGWPGSRPMGRPKGRPGGEPGASQPAFSDSPRARTTVTMLDPGQVAKWQKHSTGKAGATSSLQEKTGTLGSRQGGNLHLIAFYLADKNPFRQSLIREKFQR